MKKKRSGHSSVALGDFVYVFGSRVRKNEFGFSKLSIERLDASRIGLLLSWEEIHVTKGEMPGRSDFAISVIGENLILLAGGTNDN